MWNSVDQKPPFNGGPIIIRGVVNIGSEHEAKTVFPGFYDYAAGFLDVRYDSLSDIKVTGWQPLPPYEDPQKITVTLAGNANCTFVQTCETSCTTVCARLPECKAIYTGTWQQNG